MIRLERTSVLNLENAMRGARNPMNSWQRMDSEYDENGDYCLGPNDLDLAMRLRKAGSDHRKFIRHDHLTKRGLAIMENIIAELEEIRQRFVTEKRKEDWYDLIQLLPSSYNQLRTCTLNYETLVNIYYARKEHKLEEWHTFCRWIEELPYAKELIVG